MIFIGIDPGLTGAVASLSVDVALVGDTPIHRVGKSKRVYDVSRMRRELSALLDCGEECFAILEQQQAMPKQGVSSTFKTGQGFGLWEGILAALHIRYEIVHPTRWKKRMLDGLPTKDKASSRIVAGRLFPDVDLGRRKDNGRSDALLLAEYGRRTMEPTPQERNDEAHARIAEGEK